MWAAAEGHSNLGIPKSVGEEFVKHDAAGKPESGDLNEFEAAEAVRDGELPSPTTYRDPDGQRLFDLFDLRITGTGMAFRESLGEWAHRDPEEWLSDKFVQRCNALSVVFIHPPPGENLNSEQYRERNIGTIVLPYVRDNEVWGIGRIYDEDAALLMRTTHTSTSPGVLPRQAGEGGERLTLENGAQVLDEGLPLVLDHLAVCAAGVWDKGGPAEGVRLDSALIGKGEVVTDEEKAALEKERDDARKDAADSKAELEKEREDRAKKDSERESEREEKERDDKAKKDAADAEAKEKADSAKRDSRKDRHAKHDAKKDGEIMDCARCDAEEKEEEKEREDKAKKDAAKEVEVDPDRGTEEIKDSAKIASMEKQIADLMRTHRPLTIDEQDERSKAYHKYSGLFQMLMDTVKEPMPGEMPIAFRKRCSNALRRYTTSFKNYVFHDTQQLRDFELVEREIFDEATAYAKNPPHEDVVGQVRAIKDTQTLPGKVITTFVGDQHAVWEPFKAPTRLLKKVNHQPRGAAF